MNSPPVQLRAWRDDDLPALVTLNSDPEVMQYFPALISAEESRAMLERLRRGIEERGWGLWAVDVGGECAGFTGLAQPRFEAAFTPCVEIGWRLRREFWGRGIAFAAAQQAERYAWEQLRLAELVSFTTTANARSRRLMERLGFRHDASGDFEHPAIPVGHPIRPHVLYRKSNPSLA